MVVPRCKFRIADRQSRVTSFALPRVHCERRYVCFPHDRPALHVTADPVERLYFRILFVIFHPPVLIGLTTQFVRDCTDTFLAPLPASGSRAAIARDPLSSLVVSYMPKADKRNQTFPEPRSSILFQSAPLPPSTTNALPKIASKCSSCPRQY